jgi:hypothetical protein
MCASGCEPTVEAAGALQGTRAALQANTLMPHMPNASNACNAAIVIVGLHRPSGNSLGTGSIAEDNAIDSRVIAGKVEDKA